MHDIRITKKELNRLLRFIGYGNLNAPLWFLGLEESLGPRPDNPGWSPMWELKTRSQWDAVMDVRAAHLSLQDHYWQRRNYSNVWKVMAQLARGILHKQADWADTNKAHLYVIQSLGQDSGETLLGEIMPLPASRLSTWPYQEFIPTRAEYQKHLWPKRKDLWEEIITDYQPKYVFCYGKTYWPKYRQLFLGANWLQLGNTKIMMTTMNSTRIYLTPFFGNGAYRRTDLETIINHTNG